MRLELNEIMSAFDTCHARDMCDALLLLSIFLVNTINYPIRKFIRTSRLRIN